MIAQVSAELLEPYEPTLPDTRALRDRARHPVTISWFGTTVAMWFEDPTAAELVRSRYASFQSFGPPALAHVAAHDANGDYVFWMSSGRSHRWTRCPLDSGAAAFLADVVVRRAYFSEHAPFASFHAAAIRSGDRAAAIVGLSEHGKTTTAVACARRGMPIYSDERCIVIDGTVRPFPRALNLRRPSLRMLAAERVPDDAGIGARLRERLPGDWPCAAFDDLFGADQLASPAPLAAIFFIDAIGSFAEVRPMQQAESLTKLLAAPLRSAARGLDRVAQALSLMRGVQSYALTLGSPDQTACLIQTVLARATRGFKAVVCAS